MTCDKLWLAVKEITFLKVEKHFKPEREIGLGYYKKTPLLSKGNFCVQGISVL